MKKIIVLIALLIFGSITWVIYSTNRNTEKNYNKPLQISPSVVSQQSPKKEPETKLQEDETQVNTDVQAYPDWSDSSSQGNSPFPPPFVEKKGNIAERTIHMGVRQWEWYPVKIEVKLGEKVILIMHNADVPHSIFIPELDVREDIPEDGAVVIFKAEKRGTFDFFCATPCGQGHSLMRGSITII